MQIVCYYNGFIYVYLFYFLTSFLIGFLELCSDSFHCHCLFMLNLCACLFIQVKELVSIFHMALVSTHVISQLCNFFEREHKEILQIRS